MGKVYITVDIKLVENISFFFFSWSWQGKWLDSLLIRTTVYKWHCVHEIFCSYSMKEINIEL